MTTIQCTILTVMTILLNISHCLQTVLNRISIIDLSQALFAAKQTKFPEIISTGGNGVEIVIKKDKVLANLLKLNIIQPKYETTQLNYNA